MVSNSTYGVWLYSSSTVLHQLDQKIIYPHYDFKHLTKRYFEIGMKLNDFSIQLVKYCLKRDTVKTNMRFSNVKPVNVALVKPEVQYFSNSILLRKKF